MIIESVSFHTQLELSPLNDRETLLIASLCARERVHALRAGGRIIIRFLMVGIPPFMFARSPCHRTSLSTV
jgi:hypothetical protein